MKFTDYFHYVHNRPDRNWIRLEWIERVVTNPEYEIIQPDGRIRRWGSIPEADGRYLRVIILEDGKTIHNAFFDRSFREVNNGD